MSYSAETVFAQNIGHSDQMECCEKPSDDHSCCDDHQNDSNHCSETNCCDCVLMVNILDFNFFPSFDLNIISHLDQVRFPLVFSAFKSPVFPVWTPPDIA